MMHPDFEPLKREFQRRFPEVRLDDINFSETAMKAALNQLVVDIADQLIPRAAMMVGIGRDDLKRRLTKVGMVEIPEVNGFTRSQDSWRTFEIGLNEGLMMFFHKITKVFVSRVGVAQDIGHAGKKPKILEEPKIRFEDVVSVAKGLMKAFWEGTLLQQSSLGLMQLSNNQIGFASIILHYSEVFAVAHEFGHIVARLCRRNPDELVFGHDLMQALLAQVPELSNTTKAELSEQWGEEVGADLLGLGLSIQHADNERAKVLAYSAAEFVLIGQKMLEAFYDKRYKRSAPTGRHPPSWIRLQALRAAVCKSNPPAVLQLGEAFESMADSILSEV